MKLKIHLSKIQKVFEYRLPDFFTCIKEFMFSRRNKNDFEDLEELEELKSELKPMPFEKKLGKRSFRFDRTKRFEPIAKTINITNLNCSGKLELLLQQLRNLVKTFLELVTF